MSPLVLVCVLVCGGVVHVQGAALEWSPAVFSVETTVLLDEGSHAHSGAGPGQGLERGAGPGYRLRAALSVAPVWTDGADALLRLHLTQVVLHARGAHPRADWLPRPSPWDAWPSEPFHALLRAGKIHSAHLPLDDHPDHANYKRALLSLFQFQEEAGEREETDVSGTCRVLYETISELEFRKIKRACEWPGDGAAHNGTESWHGAVVPRRVTRYTRGGGGGGGELREVYAEEVVELEAPGAALKARSWHRLRREPEAPVPAVPRAASLRDALLALPPPAPLPLQAPADEEPDHLYDLELEPAVARALGVALGAVGEGDGSGQGEEEEEGSEVAGRGGSARQAAGVLEALPALRAAAAPALRALLHRYTRRPALLGGVVRLLGLAGTRAAHAAAGALLQLRDEPLRPLADLYLDALALAPRHDEEVVRDVLQLGASARDPRVAGAALLAAAAAARRPGALADAVRDALVVQLARCKDDECRSVRLLAMGNLRRADAVPLLLRHAEEGGRDAALAALDALGAAPARAVPPAACRRLLRLARAGRPLVVRAAALDLAVVRYFEAPGVPVHLALVAHDLEESAPAELRRVFRQRLDALAETHEPHGAGARRGVGRGRVARGAALGAGGGGGAAAARGGAPAGAGRGRRAARRARRAAVDARAGLAGGRRRRGARRARRAGGGGGGAGRGGGGGARDLGHRRASAARHTLHRTGGVDGARVGGVWQHGDAGAARGGAAARARLRGAAARRRAAAPRRRRRAGRRAGRAGAGVAVVAHRARAARPARRRGRVRARAPAHRLGRPAPACRSALRPRAAHRRRPRLLRQGRPLRARTRRRPRLQVQHDDDVGGGRTALARAALARARAAARRPHARARRPQRRPVRRAARRRLAALTLTVCTALHYTTLRYTKYTSISTPHRATRRARPAPRSRLD